MDQEHKTYHRSREQQCREMAQTASDPEIRRRHEELAQLHAARAEQYRSIAA